MFLPRVSRAVLRDGHSRFLEKLGLEKQLCQTNPFQGLFALREELGSSTREIL